VLLPVRQVRTPSYTEHVAVEIEAETNPEGIAEVAVPPEAKVEVWVSPQALVPSQAVLVVAGLSPQNQCFTCGQDEL
jgi:hypothetical protein